MGCGLGEQGLMGRGEGAGVNGKGWIGRCLQPWAKPRGKGGEGNVVGKFWPHTAQHGPENIIEMHGLNLSQTIA